MISLDGQSGGGQLVRTAVATSAVANEPVRMENVRGARSTPGLRAQHVAAIETVGALSGATTENVEIGAEEYVFDPGPVAGGTHEQPIATAGSVTLVFDAVLPLAVALTGPAAVTVSGGTDVEWSPPYDYFRHVKLPVLRSIGVSPRTSIERRGFYPSGGGTADLELDPSDLARLELTDRGPLESIAVYSVAAAALESASVADRQATATSEALDEMVDVPVETTVSYPKTIDKGSAIVLVATFGSSIAGFSALGEPGKPSEEVATTATDRLERFLETDAAVDRYLADQLVPFLAFAGGRVRIPAVTSHVETHLELLREFGYEVRVDRTDDTHPLLVADGPERYGTVP